MPNRSPGRWLVEYGRPGYVPLWTPDGKKYVLTLVEARALAQELLEEVKIWEAKLECLEQ